MPWKLHMLYFVLTLTSLQLCSGHAAETEDVFVQRPELQGSLHFRSVVPDRHHAAPTRHGSLAFRFDEQGDHKPTPVLHNLMDAKLKRMDPSVQCSDNLMTLKINGIRAPHFLVDSGEGPLTPLSQMPSKCGFSVKRSRRDVRIAAPYQGCHVTQQGGDYVLPLRLWGAPMRMSCPAALPPASVSCFPSGMVVKIGGIAANELKVKVSDTWKSLALVCSSCGIAVDVISGGLTLTAPYNRGLCIKIKDEQYLLSLLLADAELLVTCPSLPDIKPTTATTTPPSDNGQVLQYPQYPQYPQFPMFPQYPVFPGPTPLPHTPAPTTSTVAPLPQYPQLPLGAASESNTENQEAPAAQHPAFPFLPQYPQYPQYPLFPKPLPPTQSTANKNPAAPPAKLPQMPQSPQYPFPFSPQFPMVPGIFHPTAPPPPPATTTEVTTPAPTTKHDGKPLVPKQPQFLMPPQYPFLQFPKLPLPPQGQAPQDPKPVSQQPNPYHAYPQIYQVPVLYPPPKYPSQRQNTQTAAPVTTSTTSAATTIKPAAQKQFYYPHPYMPAYYVPQKAPIPVFPDPPANPAPSDQHERQPMFRAMPPFYPFPSHQRPKSAARNW